MNDERLPWFHCYPSKLLGAIASMKPDQKLVYLVMLLRIYEVRGPCPDTIDAIATRCGINRRRTSEALDALFKAGKLVREGAGIINPFAANVLAKGDALHRERQRAGSAGGSKRAEKTETIQSPGPSKARAAPKHLDSDLNKKGVSPNGETLFALDEDVEWPKDYCDQFWRTYPKRTEKKSALAKLEAIKKSKTVSWSAFFAGVMRYAAYCLTIEERFIKQPTTWLNKGCWDDELKPRTAANPESRHGVAALSIHLNSLDQLEDHHAPHARR